MFPLLETDPRKEWETQSFRTGCPQSQHQRHRSEHLDGYCKPFALPVGYKCI